MLPFCSDKGEPINNGHPVPFTSRGIYIGAFYLALFVVTAVPQALVLYAIAHKHHLQYSCYKLMLMVSIYDILNLIEALLFPGFFSVLNLSHCDIGVWTFAVGESILYIWFAYCFTSITLAANRLLEFVYKPLSDFLFQRYRAWFWVIPAWTYSITMNLTIHRPYYLYIPDKGEWSFYEISDDNTQLVENPNHITNNTTKSALIAGTYFLMFIILKIQLRKAGAQMSKVEVMLSIQAFIIGILSIFSSFGFIMLSYLPINEFFLLGPVEEFFWAAVHGGSAYIYLTMNKSIRQTALAPFGYGFKAVTVKSIATSGAVNNADSRPQRVG
ncbi:hypothetical protein QR680_015751 [Steinernema hermaphroditum]|uniref:Uncharacterized protein n=1 Tax=Steinernema hermaphroditum TaxID=289476 RepID=A0AA39H9W7_9BILA|nr:hypothetical protein QR680_015751 [Steinernema hermaphroditum]